MLDTDGLPRTRTLVLAALCLLVISGLVVVNKPVHREIARYPIQARITPDVQNMSVGISVDTDTINFGTLPARIMSAEKHVAVRNNDRYTLTGQAHVEGNITRFITVFPRTIHLQPQDAMNITLKTNSTRSTAPGTYTGVLVLDEQTPLWRWLWKHN